MKSIWHSFMASDCNQVFFHVLMVCCDDMVAELSHVDVYSRICVNVILTSATMLM